jgi:ABC-type antimicrobial peptide transport system permease subunit
MFSNLQVLVRIAFANIISSALNVFVGLVLLFGSALLVIGGAVFTTLDDSLSKSIVDSITGHLQVFSARSKDQLEIYGKVDGSDVNLVPLEDFPALKTKLLGVPNVAKVVPMGGASALVSVGNAVDVTLEKLRGVYRAQRGDGLQLPEDEFRAKAESLKQHVRNIVAVLAQDIQRETELTDGSAIEPHQKEALARAATDAFWADFDADPFSHLELLENRVAPLVADGDVLFLRCLGTDLDAYQESFKRMAIVEGGPVPKGSRGVLLPRFFAEELLKLKNARRLDKLKDARAAGRRISDTSDKELQRFVRENVSQSREIILQLDGRETALAVSLLQSHLGSKASTLEELLPEFFAVTDGTFDARYTFFYEKLAPMLTLYRARVGDTITLKSFGRSGSTITVLVKVFGIFELRGLEKSPLAGANALVDIVTFRDLYGFLGAEMKAELDELKAQVAAKQVDREGAEDALFGGDTELVAETTAATIDETRSSKQVVKQKETFDVAEIDTGVVLHAAVLLKDGSESAQRTTAQALEQVLAPSRKPVVEETLAKGRALADSGALPFQLKSALQKVVELESQRAQGMPVLSTTELLALKAALKPERPTLPPNDVATLEALYEGALPSVFAVSWVSAAGFLGKFIEFFRLLLFAVIAAFAFIALIVVTLGMTIATLQRTQTIGTMRAIGAQRSFVVTMVVVETLVLALAFGGVGAAVGSAVVRWLHARGIPAFRDELYFFFSGPVLRPELSAGIIFLAVSLIAVIIPTYLATRVAPVTAMQATE